MALLPQQLLIVSMAYGVVTTLTALTPGRHANRKGRKGLNKRKSGLHNNDPFLFLLEAVPLYFLYYIFRFMV
jgi:hypothetical protein